MADALPFEDGVAYLKDEAPRLLSRALVKGGNFADLFYENSVYQQASWRQTASAQKVDVPRKRAQRHMVEGIGIRAFQKEQIGFAATADLSPESLHAVADNVAMQMEGGDLARASKAPGLGEGAIRIESSDLAEREAMLQAAADAALGYDVRVRQVVVTYQEQTRRIFVAPSEGTAGSKTHTSSGLRVEVTLVEQGNEISGRAIANHSLAAGQHLAMQLAQTAVAQAQRLTEARSLASGIRPVILASGWGGVWLHEAVGHLLEADVGVQWVAFSDRLGTSVCASDITLVDDPTLSLGRGSYPFDDEGMRASPTMLIEEGVLRWFMTDRYHAVQLGLPRTGNGRRQDYRHRPLPRMSNLILQPGNDNPTGFLADVHEGLYVKDVGQGSVQPNGDFVFNVLEGYRIEHGRLTHPVRNVCIVGNGLESLQHIVGVGHDFHLETARGVCKKSGQVVPVSIGMPTVLISEMHVASDNF